MSNGHVWRAAQERLRQQMTGAQFDTWLRGTWLTTSGDGATVLCVRTTFAKELLEARYLDRIAAAITGVTGQPCALRVSVAPTGPSGADSAADSAQAQHVAPPHTASHHVGSHRQPHAEQARPLGPSLFEDAPPVTDDEPGVRTAAEPRERRTLVPPAMRRRPVGADASGGVARSGRVRAALDRARGSEPNAATDSAEAQAAADERATRAANGREAGAANDASGASERATVASRAQTRRDGVDGTASMDNSRDNSSGTGGMRDDGRAPMDGERVYGGYAGMERTPSEGVALPGYGSGPLRLNPRYTFSTFIVGSSNRFAFSASQAVAEAPGLAYNPLFLYGGVGLGKTHLLHAIGHTAVENGLVVLYVSSETFTNEIINAIRYRTTEEFRAKYRSVDVLLVDDIQFIAGKDSTEEEFFHTFNTLHENSKQIVMCSDRPPKAIVSLAERLRSRFEWGLIADIQPPDQETRVAILRAKADMMGRHVPDEVINFLAIRVQSNIRELEGSFNRLFAFAQLQGLPLSIETAKAALASLATDGRQRRVDIAEVLDAVAEYYRISAEDLRGKQRDKHIVVPRQVAMYLMRQETEASLLEIGQALGGRDHSTVLHGCEKIGREVNENTALRKEIFAIRQQLLG